jgi:hypothetical protein
VLNGSSGLELHQLKLVESILTKIKSGPVNEAMLEQMPHKDLVQQLATLVERDNQLASGDAIAEASLDAQPDQMDTVGADRIDPVCDGSIWALSYFSPIS